MNKQLQVFLWEKLGEAYTEASFSVHMHTNCELDVLKTTLHRTRIYIKNNIYFEIIKKVQSLITLTCTEHGKRLAQYYIYIQKE